MKKILSLLFVICSILTAFTGCKNETDVSEPQVPEINKYDLELEAALRLEKEKAWFGAYALLDDLIERGYYSEYAEKRDELYEKYLIASVVHHVLANKNLKENLKNPSSLVIYNISVTTRLSEYSGNPVFEVTYDYGATNSFGGMVRDTITGTYSGKEAAPYYEGKKIDYSHVNLNDLAKMDKYYDWEESKMWGDYELYLYNRRNQVEGNIWSD